MQTTIWNVDEMVAIAVVNIPVICAAPTVNAVTLGTLLMMSMIRLE